MGCTASSYNENTDDFTEINSKFFSLYCETSPSKFIGYEILRLAYLQHMSDNSVHINSEREFDRILIKMVKERICVLYGSGCITVIVGLHLHSWVKRPIKRHGISSYVPRYESVGSSCDLNAIHGMRIRGSGGVAPQSILDAPASPESPATNMTMD